MNRWVFLFFWIGIVTTVHSQKINNIPPPLCGISPGGEKFQVVKEKPDVFRGKFFYTKDTIPIGKDHYWFLYIEDLKAEPIEFANISASAINVEQGVGMAKPPKVSNHIGNGHYLVRNVHFSKPGRWTVRFFIIKNRKSEVLSFEVDVEN